MLRSRRVKKVKMQKWGDLPLELLRSVMAYLEIKDNILASLVSKSWYDAAVSVRVVEHPPWLLYLSECSNSYAFYNPLNGNRHELKFPESLAHFFILCSADGWLLMSDLPSFEFVFFNPFTRKSVVLPYFESYYDLQLVAFSSAPTSSSCVVVIIKNYIPGHLTISTWSHGQTLWTSIVVESQFRIDRQYNNVIFSNGLIYCLNCRNSLAVFDLSLGKFDVLDVPPPRPSNHIDGENWYKSKFMVENKGHIYVICLYGNNEHMVFELNLEQGIWEEKRSVGSLTMFVCMYSCESRSYVGDGMKRNSIYFSKLCCNNTCTMTYSFHERRYCPCEDSFDWVEGPYGAIWIKPPQNVSELII